MKTHPQRLWSVSGFVLVFLAIGWLGFWVRPASYAPYAEPNCSVPTGWLPAGLPPPVQRYFSVLFGPTYSQRDVVPVLGPAVVTGRGSVTVASLAGASPLGALPLGLRAPARFHGYYTDGGTFARSASVSWLGIPLVHTTNAYSGGKGVLQMAGTSASSPQSAQAETLTYWAEAAWTPSLFVRDARVRWEAVDDVTARLVVPAGDGQDSLLVKFDPQSGLMQSMSAQRYRSADAQEKSAWRVDYSNWRSFHEVLVPAALRMSWDGQADPAEILTVENIEYGVHLFLGTHPEFASLLGGDGAAE